MLTLWGPSQGLHGAVFIDYFLKWVEICPVWKLLLMWLLTNSCLRSLPGMVRQNIWCQFVSDMLESVLATMGPACRLTTAYHPQFNQTERLNRMIKIAIRSYVGSKHRDKDRHLSLISFALKTAPHQSTGDSPAFSPVR